MWLQGLSDPRTFLGQDAISYSEMTALALCEKKWQLTYNGPRRENSPSAAMQLGTEMHRLLGRWWGLPGQPPEDWTQTEDNTALWLMERYSAAYGNASAHLTMMQLEVPFAVKLPWGPYLFGWFDGQVYDHSTKSNWLVEFKTMGNWSKLEQLPVDKQITLYIWAANQMGLNVRGVMYDAVKTQQWKTGKHELWESFDRRWVTRNPDQIEECLSELASACRVRGSLEWERAPIRNVGQHCGWCSCMPECYGLELDIQPEA
jgi:hypothetical protein